MKLTIGLSLLVVCAGLGAQEPAGSGDRLFQQMREEAETRSQVRTAFDRFVTVIGPRLTGTPAYKAAADWSRDTLASWGLSNARLETWEFGRGWTLDRLTIELVEPRYLPLIGYAEAWSASTQGEIVGTPVLTGGTSPQEVAAMRAQLAGAIVMTQPIVAAFIDEDRPQPTASETPVRIGAPPTPGPRPNQAGARQVAQAVREAGAAVLVRPSAGEHGTVFVLGRDQGENARPSIVLAAEHYNMVARMIEAGVPVKLRVNVQARFLTGDTKGYNVVAELPGSDPVLKDEVVMIGAHLDSWHTATGATDNADGAAAAMEALRILKAVDARPRRTIRIALWGGEEQGLLGSRAYVQQHLAGDTTAAAREKLFVYLNIDPGMGPIYGWYMEENAAAKAVFDRWIGPLEAAGVRRNILQGIGNTDHLSFKPVGVPAFNPVQDYVDYDVRTHHTNVDTYERVREDDLKQNALVLAWMAYQAAQMDGRFPK
jgi:hypothetical protein